MAQFLRLPYMLVLLFSALSSTSYTMHKRQRNGRSMTKQSEILSVTSATVSLEIADFLLSLTICIVLFFRNQNSTYYGESRYQIGHAAIAITWVDLDKPHASGFDSA